MARTEQKYLVDRETVEHLVSMLRDGMAKGASDDEIREQTWEILDSSNRGRTDQSLKELREGKIKRFKNAKQMVRDLETH